mmetsp:Transcript_24919/g.63205  ORF Transcript_24919/g.63205 Transcript_24919/m.63205 type:complete len:220 (-) Transcript_24919:850-1509(-)
MEHRGPGSEVVVVDGAGLAAPGHQGLQLRVRAPLVPTARAATVRAVRERALRRDARHGRHVGCLLVLLNGPRVLHAVELPQPGEPLLHVFEEERRRVERLAALQEVGAAVADLVHRRDPPQVRGVQRRHGADEGRARLATGVEEVPHARAGPAPDEADVAVVHLVRIPKQEQRHGPDLHLRRRQAPQGALRQRPAERRRRAAPAADVLGLARLRRSRAD